MVEPDLSLSGHPEAFAVGDLAHMVDPASGAPYPQLAPVAVQSGAHAARQLLTRLEGGDPEPFGYRDKGIMATVGRGSAIAELPSGFRLRGSLAWLAWLVLHLLFLVGFRNRLSVLVQWGWNYLTWDRGPRIILRDETDRERRGQTVTAG